MKPLLTISFILLTCITWGQGKADKELRRFFKKHKVDTFVLVKTGCTNCIISYEDNNKLTDTVTIWLLYKYRGKQSLITFSDIAQTKNLGDKDTDIFKFITENRQLLIKKDKYYQEQKQLKFQAPCLMTFPYENIEIKYGNFKHRHRLVKRETDDCGTFLTHEDWFQVEIELLRIVDKLKT